MPTVYEFATGVGAVLLGAAWIVWPTAMIQLQRRVLYFGQAEYEGVGESDAERLLGRIGGLALVAFGLVLVFGILP